jgi:helix-turn-helix protein
MKRPATTKAVDAAAAARTIPERRMAEARRLLSETDDSAETIGTRVDYNDPAYFNRRFRTPTVRRLVPGAAHIAGPDERPARRPARCPTSTLVMERVVENRPLRL